MAQPEADAVSGSGRRVECLRDAVVAAPHRAEPRGVETRVALAADEEQGATGGWIHRPTVEPAGFKTAVDDRGGVSRSSRGEKTQDQGAGGHQFRHADK